MRAYNASSLREWCNGRRARLKPELLRVRVSPPALIFEMGMNAKRSRDRFFKPELASSSLPIPASFMAVEPKRCGAGLWNQC